MSTTKVEQTIEREVNDRTLAVIHARDSFAAAARELHSALVEVRVAARALEAIHPGHGYVSTVAKYDSEARDLVAELASMVEGLQPRPPLPFTASNGCRVTAGMGGVGVAGEDGGWLLFAHLDSQDAIEAFAEWVTGR